MSVCEWVRTFRTYAVKITLRSNGTGTHVQLIRRAYQVDEDKPVCHARWGTKTEIEGGHGHMVQVKQFVEQCV